MPWSDSGIAGGRDGSQPSIARRDSTAMEGGARPTNDGRRHHVSPTVGMPSGERLQRERNACNPRVSGLNGISAAPIEKLVAFAVAPGVCISA